MIYHVSDRSYCVRIHLELSTSNFREAIDCTILILYMYLAALTNIG